MKKVFFFNILFFVNYSYIIIFSMNQDDIDDFVAAAKSDDLETIKSYIEKGIDPNIFDQLGRSALSLACLYDNEEIVKYLIGLPNINLNLLDKNRNQSSLHYACWNNHSEIVKLLIESGADINLQENFDGGCTPLHYAVHESCHEVIKILLNSKYINVNLKDSNHKTALFYAVENNDTKSINLLAGKTDYIFIKSAIELAQNLDFSDTLKYLKNIEKIKMYKSKLFDAIKFGRCGEFKYYVTKITLSLFDEEGNTPLHLAIKAGQTDIVKLILMIRPDLVEKRNNLSYDAVEYAIFCSKFNILNLFTKAAINK